MFFDVIVCMDPVPSLHMPDVERYLFLGRKIFFCVPGFKKKGGL